MQPFAPLLVPMLLLATLASTAVHATESPEIKRPVAKPQTVGTVHTLRAIPEACVRIEGRFTDTSAQGYASSVVRTHPNCQPRARWIDAATAKPSPAAGWILNDIVRVPKAACPTQQAVVRVWRRPGGVATPSLDGQGRARVYLEDAMKAAPSTAKLPAFSAVTVVEGKACAPARVP